MIHITNLDEGLELFKALGSEVRMQILNILLDNDQMSMNPVSYTHLDVYKRQSQHMPYHLEAHTPL